MSSLERKDSLEVTHYLRRSLEGFQVPALLQNLREFGDLDKPAVARFLRLWVQPDGKVWVGWFNDDDLFVEITLDSLLVSCNRGEKEPRRVATPS